jgi:4-hydroxybenzoate polyprenyltransferase
LARPTFAAAAPRSSLLAWLQLLRLPNVFTAMADVLLGFLLTHAGWQPVGVLVALLLSSSLLYLAGMVLNDVYDVEVDQVERPGRPLPSGQIALGTARWLGYSLLIGGVGLGWLATLLSGDSRCGLTATALASAVWFYDAVLKSTWAAPLGMGVCRFLNVLLGMSAASTSWQAMHWIVAAGIGIYITGLTWFARGEAGISSRWRLAGGLAVMLVGLGVVAWYPQWYAPGVDPVSRPRMLDATTPDAARFALQWWCVFWLLIGLLISRRSVHAILDPVPRRVQQAVKQGIWSLIVIDAAAATAVREPKQCLVILALLLPTMLLGRWVYST